MNPFEGYHTISSTLPVTYKSIFSEFVRSPHFVERLSHHPILTVKPFIVEYNEAFQVASDFKASGNKYTIGIIIISISEAEISIRR